ncbi:hypothetical protein [Mycolicibacterium pyrenivorans]|uniref:hypothetical protein n=1 Tax=Mycolicibacterium pyrenivorans TaxID=187102 RepID=UPI0021F315F1|nr:hypothetical protein [Mycolicibacterium pyrenivorans]
MRSHRYALGLQAQQRGNGVLGLREYYNPVCVRSRPRQTRDSTPFLAPRGDNVERIARMRRGGGRSAVRRFDSRGVRRERSVALRNVVRHGWERRRGADGGVWRPAHPVVSLGPSRGGERLGRGPAGQRYVAVAGVVARPSWTN